MGFKAGIGSASRQVVIGSTTFTIGILVQSNFGGSLVINNVPIGQLLAHQELQDGGSIMIILGTDAPLSHRQLRRVLKRAILGLTRTGWRADHGSGDYVLASQLLIVLKRSRLHWLMPKTKSETMNTI